MGGRAAGAEPRCRWRARDAGCRRGRHQQPNASRPVRCSDFRRLSLRGSSHGLSHEAGMAIDSRRRPEQPLTTLPSRPFQPRTGRRCWPLGPSGKALSRDCMVIVRRREADHLPASFSPKPLEKMARHTTGSTEIRYFWRRTFPNKRENSGCGWPVGECPVPRRHAGNSLSERRRLPTNLGRSDQPSRTSAPA